MVASIVVGLIIFIIAVVIYIELRNEKRYKEDQKRKEEKRERKLTPKVTKRPPVTTTHTKKDENSVTTTPKPAHLQKSVSPVQKQRETAPLQLEDTRAKDEEPPSVKTLNKPQPSKTDREERKHSIELPKGEYPDFNYERLIEMGLTEEEALGFIQELIPQIGEQIPLIDDAMKIPDFHKMERLTHSIKGSSTTIGTGGVSDLLVEFNTYLKEGNNVQIAQAYQRHLKRYFEKLKKQFPKED